MSFTDQKICKQLFDILSFSGRKVGFNVFQKKLASYDGLFMMEPSL
jgi:hypothetical protein